MTIATKIISGDLYDAKNEISEKLNELALGLMVEAKSNYARTLFVSEEFDAKPKGKTDVDIAKDEEKDSDDNDDSSDDDSDNDNDSGNKSDDDSDDKDDDSSDDKDNDSSSNKKAKGVTINVKEGADLQEKDLFHKGKGFNKVAAKAAKEYGSAEAGKRVAGAILKKMRAGHVKGGVKE